jgi:predicted regulator of Ras-like GTPase activity (Roadblock/LC7/MglB family)
MEYNNIKKSTDNTDKAKKKTELIQLSLEFILKELINGVPGVKAAAIVSIEGMPVVSALPVGMTEDKMAATTSMLLSLAERAINEMNVGDLEQLSIRGSIANLVVLAAGQKNVLTVLTEKTVNLGYVFIECERICQKISQIFK